MDSIETYETYAYGRSKDLICKNKEVKCSNIIKQCKKLFTLLMLLENIQKIKIQIGRKFLIINREY